MDRDGRFELGGIVVFMLHSEVAHASGYELGKMFVDKSDGEAWPGFEVVFFDCSKKGCWSWDEHTGMKVAGEVLSSFEILNDS